MVRPCKRRKVKNPSGKVSRRANKNVVKRTAVTDITVGKFWDSQKTIHQNFDAVGLVSKVNADLSTSSVKNKLVKWQAERIEKLIEVGEENMKKEEEEERPAFLRPMLDEEAIFSRLEELFDEDSDGEEPGPNGSENTFSVDIKNTVIEELKCRSRQQAPKKPKPLSEFELDYIQKLIQKHGSDFQVFSWFYVITIIFLLENGFRP